MPQAQTQPAGTNRFQMLVESICRANDLGQPIQTEDLRQVFTQLQINVQAALPGGQWVTPGGTKQTGSVTPTGTAFTVTGANGAFNIAIGNPTNAQGKTVWFEISYSPLASFTQNVVTMPLSSATTAHLNAPGASYYFRLRTSFDQVNWTPYQMAAGNPVASGLVSSAATANAGALNQTNFGVVTSTATGSTAEVMVQGANGPYTSLVAQKGPRQSSLPGAVIVGFNPGTDQFIAYDGSKYVARSTLAGVLADDTLTPIGKVSVVDVGAPALPAVSIVRASGGGVIAWNVTDPGNGLTGPVTLLIVTSTGTGATPGPQTIQNGKLISIGPGNPGQNYAGGDTVDVSGGISPGVPGGGTAIGGNGARMTAV